MPYGIGTIQNLGTLLAEVLEAQCMICILFKRYPGLMMTSGLIHWVLHKLAIPIDIRNVCVFLAPIFSAFTSLAAYGMTKEITKRSEAGLLSALFVAIVPSYMSRSVAGSYDNEGVSIFALVFTFYTFLKTVNTGSILWGVYTALA